MGNPTELWNVGFKLAGTPCKHIKIETGFFDFRDVTFWTLMSGITIGKLKITQ